MLRKISKIIEKNFRLLIRSKSSSLIVILGPLILILLVGLAFSHSKPYSIDVGVYANNPNDLTISLMERLNEEQFRVKNIESYTECIEAVKTSDIDICMALPSNFVIKENHRNNIIFNVDYSNINLVYAVLEVITEKVNEESKQISTDLTTDILTVLDNAKNEINKDLGTAVEINDQNEKMLQRTNNMEKRLKELNLEFDRNDFKVEELIKKLDEIKGVGDQAITQGKTAFDNIENKMNDLNFSESEKNQIDNIMSITDESLDELSIKLDKMYEDGSNATSIGKLIANINSNLELVQVKFTKAAAARTQTVEDLTNIDITLSDSMTKLNSIQSSMEIVKETIENIKVKNAADIVSPINTKINPVTAEKTHFNLLFPTLIVLVSMITGILLGSTLVIVEKKSKSFFRNNITPTSDVIFNVGTYITGLIVMVIQLVIFLLISTFAFKANIWQSIGMNSIILICIVSLFILLGMLIGVMFRSEETTTLAAITLASILLFFSSVVLPLESMPMTLMKISEYNPFVISSELLKQSLLFNLPFENLASRLMIIIGYVLLIFIVTIKVQKMIKAKEFYHMHKKSKELRIVSMYKDFTKKKEKEWHKTRLKDIEMAEKKVLDNKKTKLEIAKFGAEKEAKLKDEKVEKVLDEVAEHNREIEGKITWLNEQLKKI